MRKRKKGFWMDGRKPKQKWKRKIAENLGTDQNKGILRIKRLDGKNFTL
jgi:hypothetical protein